MTTATHKKTNTIALKVLVLPVFIFVAQSSGCLARPTPPPPPGGTYFSASAGANFDQSVMLEGTEGNIAGFALGKAHRPEHDPGTVYVAAGRSGIVVSRNGGETWEKLSTPLAHVFDVVALVNGTLVASGSAGSGQGYIIRSLDSAKSWEVVLTIPVPADKEGLQIIKNSNSDEVAAVVLSIEPDPFNQDRIYAGGNLGDIFVGEQSAKVWSQLQSLTFEKSAPKKDPGRFAASDIIPSPHREGEIFIITAAGALLRARNGEQEEVSIPKSLLEPAAYEKGKKKTVLDMTFIRQFSDALFVGTGDGAVISRDNGQTWEQLPIPIGTTQTFNSSQVAISPTNSNRLLVAINDVVYRSEDGGSTWNTYSFGLASHFITNILIDPNNAARVLTITSPVALQ